MTTPLKKVILVGGGFAGLNAAKILCKNKEIVTALREIAEGKVCLPETEEEGEGKEKGKKKKKRK